MAKSTSTTKQAASRIRYKFRHGVSREKLDKFEAYFAPGGYLSGYGYEMIETDGDTTVFDVLYNPETNTPHDTMGELNLVFRSLELQVN